MQLRWIQLEWKNVNFYVVEELNIAPLKTHVDNLSGGGTKIPWHVRWFLKFTDNYMSMVLVCDTLSQTAIGTECGYKKIAQFAFLFTFY